MTKIQWTDETINPIIGCSKISEGCKNCYAEKMAYRLANMKNTAYYSNVLKMHPINPDFGKWNGTTFFNKSALLKPFSWKKPRMIFVCSMGDLFHESVPNKWQYEVFKMMHKNPYHTFQILTKRPDIMKSRIDNINYYLRMNHGWVRLPLPNVWLGVTVENQEQAYKRIPILLDIPAEKRFVSCEPLLSHINIMDFVKTSKIDWVVAGRENGHGAREMKKEWLFDLYDQCDINGVPFFDKKNELGLKLEEIPL